MQQRLPRNVKPLPVLGPVEAMLIRFYGLFLPLTSAFSFSQIINPPLIASLLLLVWMARQDTIQLTSEAAYVSVLFLGPAMLSGTFNITFSGDERFLNHLVSYAAVVALFYLVPYSFMFYTGGRELFLKWINVGLTVSCLFLIIEFVAMNFASVDIQALIPRPVAQAYEPTVLGLWARPRSFVEESGHFALYVGLLGPTCLLLKSHAARLALSLLYMTAILLTFSTSGYIVLAGIAGLLLIRIRAAWPYAVVLVAVALAAAFWNQLAFVGQLVSNVVLDKFFSLSFAARTERFEQSFELWQDSGAASVLFGLGPGYYAYRHVDSVISLHALILFQTGLLGVAGFCLLLGKYVIKWLSIASQREVLALGISLLAMFVFYAGISNYWYPWLWTVFALIDRSPNVRAPVDWNRLVF